MSENRHRTVVEITAESSNAEAALKRLQGLFDNLAQRANLGQIGNQGVGFGGGGGGGGSLTPGAGMPSAPSSAMGGSSGSAQGGAGSGIVDANGIPYTAGAPGSPPASGGGGGGVGAPGAPAGGGGTLTPGGAPAPAPASGFGGGGGGFGQFGPMNPMGGSPGGDWGPGAMEFGAGALLGRGGFAGKMARDAGLVKGMQNPRLTPKGWGVAGAAAATYAVPEYLRYQTEQTRIMSQGGISRSLSASGAAWETGGSVVGRLGGAAAGAAAMSPFAAKTAAALTASVVGAPFAAPVAGALTAAGAIGGWFMGGEIGDAAGQYLGMDLEKQYIPGAEQRAGYADQVGQHHADFGMAQHLMGSGQFGEQTHRIRASEHGYNPQESSKMALQFAQARGTTSGSGNAEHIYKLARAGIGPGAVGAFESLARPGLSYKDRGRGTDALGAFGMANTARKFGLSGSGAEQWLQQIASHTKQMATQGLNVDVEQLSRFQRGFADQMGSWGKEVPEGLQQGIGRGVKGVQDMLYGGFGDLAQVQLLQQAGEATGWDYMKMGSELSRMNADPVGVTRKLRHQNRGDEDMFSLVYYGMTGRGFNRQGGATPYGKTEGQTVFEMNMLGWQVPDAAQELNDTRVAGGTKQKKAAAKGEAQLYDEMTLKAMADLTGILWTIKRELNEKGIIGIAKAEANEKEGVD